MQASAIETVQFTVLNHYLGIYLTRTVTMIFQPRYLEDLCPTEETKNDLKKGSGSS